jgi:RimJ/RimL family protein N-acetyltransferase
MQLEGEWINDLGYIIAQQYWRQGYGLEAVEGAVKWAKSQRLGSLVANMATDNLPSVGLAEKLGMTKLREFCKVNNQNKMTNWYELQLEN